MNEQLAEPTDQKQLDALNENWQTEDQIKQNLYILMRDVPPPGLRYGSRAHIWFGQALHTLGDGSHRQAIYPKHAAHEILAFMVGQAERAAGLVDPKELQRRLAAVEAALADEQAKSTSLTSCARALLTLAEWSEAPRRDDWGASMMCADIELTKYETMTVYVHRDALPNAD